jgi:hypothetical protein
MVTVRCVAELSSIGSSAAFGRRARSPGRSGPRSAAGGRPASSARTTKTRYQEHSQAPAWRIAAPRFPATQFDRQAVECTAARASAAAASVLVWRSFSAWMVVPTPAGQIRVQLRYLIIAAASRSSGADSEPIGSTGVGGQETPAGSPVGPAGSADPPVNAPLIWTFGPATVELTTDRPTGWPGLVYCLNAGPVCSSVRSREAARTRDPYDWEQRAPATELICQAAVTGRCFPSTATSHHQS